MWISVDRRLTVSCQEAAGVSSRGKAKSHRKPTCTNITSSVCKVEAGMSSPCMARNHRTSLNKINSSERVFLKAEVIWNSVSFKRLKRFEIPHCLFFLYHNFHQEWSMRYTDVLSCSGLCPRPYKLTEECQTLWSSWTWKCSWGSWRRGFWADSCAAQTPVHRAFPAVHGKTKCTW